MTVTWALEKHIATLSTSPKGWTMEVNLLSWNGQPAKIDVRDWSPDHDKMGKGITLTEEQAKSLLNALRRKW